MHASRPALILVSALLAATLLAAASPAPARTADERAFKRGLAKLKETMLLAAPAYNKARHEPVVRALFERIVATLADGTLEPAEAAEVAECYAAALDALKIRRRRGCDDDLRALLAAMPVPEPRVDALFKETEARLHEIKRLRESGTTPEGLLKHYGDGDQVDRSRELFARERPGGYADKADSGKIHDMLAKYYPDRAPGAKKPAEPAAAATVEVRLPDRKLVDDLFK